MITATRPVGCSRASMLLQTPCLHGERMARAALRTGVHPVGHETGPVVYWVPGPVHAQPSPARDGPPVGRRIRPCREVGGPSPGAAGGALFPAGWQRYD